MRIVFAYYGMDDDISGVTTWAVRLLKDLRKAGHEVHCIVTHFGRYRERGRLYAECRDMGVVFHWLKNTYTDKAAYAVSAILEQVKPDVYMPQILVAYHHAAMIVWPLGMPVVCAMHSDDPLYWGLLNELSTRGFAGPVVCVSDYLLRRAKSEYQGIDTRMIPYGVSCGTKQARYSNHPFKICFSGRLEQEQKRILPVVETMIYLCKAIKQVECVLIGDGTYKRQAEELVCKNSMSERIRFVGRLSNAEVMQELSTAQAVLLLSEYEGLPLAILEAMALGVVPICRNIKSGIPEIISHGQTGYLVGDDPKEVCDIIANLMLDARLWESVSSKARKLILEHYNVDASNRQWVRILEELSAVGRGRSLTLIGSESEIPAVNPLLANYDFRTPVWYKRIYRRLWRRVRDLLNID